MSRYAAMFERLRERGEGAFGAFVMLGDPDLHTSAAILDALVEGGADMIEVGIPFSDPVADGPVIQAAAERALAQGSLPPIASSFWPGFGTGTPTLRLASSPTPT
jgi:tryptophan synthase alpha chain